MITIISGTNRKKAKSRQVANYYQQKLKALGEESQIIDLALLPEDFVVSALYENSGKNEDFNIYREKIKESEKYIFVVPEYNGSFPGVLKAFIDGLQYPHSFRDKKCALVGLSSGVQGGGIAMSHLTDILNYLGMHVLALKPKLAHIEKHFEGGAVTNEFYNELIDEQLRQFIAF